MEFATHHPTHKDVLHGRGKNIFYHLGNIMFRAKIEQRCSEYSKSPDNLKKKIALAIIQEVYTAGGHFLIQDLKDKAVWLEVDDKTAITKTMQALREEVKRVKDGLASSIKKPEIEENERIILERYNAFYAGAFAETPENTKITQLSSNKNVILLENGKISNEENEMFWSLLDSKKSAFSCAATKVDRDSIAKTVVEFIAANDGSFYQMTGGMCVRLKEAMAVAATLNALEVLISDPSTPNNAVSEIDDSVIMSIASMSVEDKSIGTFKSIGSHFFLFGSDGTLGSCPVRYDQHCDCKNSLLSLMSTESNIQKEAGEFTELLQVLLPNEQAKNDLMVEFEKIDTESRNLIRHEFQELTTCMDRINDLRLAIEKKTLG